MPHPFSVALTRYKTNKAKEIVVFLIADFYSLSIEKVLSAPLKGLFKAPSKCGNYLDKNQSPYVHKINHSKNHWVKKNTWNHIKTTGQ